MAHFAELELNHGGVMARLAPGRGALVTALEVGGRSVLFMNRETFEDPARNVRGGIPLLFPFAGSLAGNTLAATGTSIRQHGFAREKAWTVLRRRAGSLRLGWESDAETEAIFPWRHRLEHAVHVIESGLHIELLVHNLGDHAMPVAPGWHPYFACPADRKGDVAGDIAGTGAGSVHDTAQVNFGVVPPTEGRARFRVPGVEEVCLSFSPEMRHLQIWTLPGQPFVCLEPFTGPPNVINTPATPTVEPGAARVFWMRIEVG